MVLERARKNKQEFIFNAAYSSAYNQIEILWAIAKRHFARDLISEANYKEKEQIKTLVIKSILQAAESVLEKHINVFWDLWTKNLSPNKLSEIFIFFLN